MASRFFLLGLLLFLSPAARGADEPTSLVGPYEARHAFRALSPREQAMQEIQEATTGNQTRFNPPMSPSDEAKPHCHSKVSATEGQLDSFVARYRESPLLEDAAHDPSLTRLIQSQVAGHRGKRVVLPIAPPSIDSLPKLTYPASIQHPVGEQRVDMAVAVSKDGDVAALLVVCAANERLIGSAVQAGRILRFHPASLAGKPVADVVAVPFVFEP